MILWLMAAAAAAPLQVGVRGVEDATALHLVFGDGGQTSAPCVPTSKGWTCASVDVDRPSSVAVIIDTTLVPAGTIDQADGFLTLAYGQGVFESTWAQEVPPAEGPAAGLLVVQVQNADPSQAPMLRVSIGDAKIQMACADDGSFPDPKPNDGVFYCAHLIASTTLQADSWRAEFTSRDAQGEDAALGSLTYEGGQGIRFATLTIGEASEASKEAFPISVTPWEPDVEVKEVILGDGEAKENDVPPSPPPSPQKPPESPELSATPEPVSQWVWLGLIFFAGCLAGHRIGGNRPKRSQGLDSAQALPAVALAGGGPVPEGGPIKVSSTDPGQTGLTIIRDMTTLRRVVLLGELRTDGLMSGHDVLQVTDPDKRAVIDLIRTLCTDGGVPPVLLIMGSEAVLETGGASPTPTLDLIEAVSPLCWVALVTSEQPDSSDVLTLWDHDPQAGWSIR